MPHRISPEEPGARTQREIKKKKKRFRSSSKVQKACLHKEQSVCLDFRCKFVGTYFNAKLIEKQDSCSFCNHNSWPNVYLQL